ncbi:helix-turn-helix domain-containing protein [Aquitalea denitrificans]|uniref:helix-turn-helix domain-containing protein n=1 Tax=Aquitalea denitrificans TaxID=519081 RepID=UPI0013598C33|nr:helix-turn-helix transcriptional regulator [Aquitalea denitrificans]
MKSIHDERYRSLIEKLIELRKDGSITQVQLAERLGKPQSYIAKIENFERRLDVVELTDWVKALGSNLQKIIHSLPWM